DLRLRTHRLGASLRSHRGVVIRGGARPHERSRALLRHVARGCAGRPRHPRRSLHGRGLRDPVTLAIVATDAPELHGRLLATLHALPVDAKVQEELRLLGLRTVGEFADLPRGSVFDRFGSAVARAHALARGEYGDMVRASAPPRRLRARRSWDDAIGSREQLVFALRVVVDEISAALARDGFAALRLELRLDREDAGPLRIERTVLPPTREAAALLRSLRWALEERSELGLVTGCALEVPEVEPARGRQIGLFAPDGARTEEAIATARYLR